MKKAHKDDFSWEDDSDDDAPLALYEKLDDFEFEPTVEAAHDAILENAVTISHQATLDRVTEARKYLYYNCLLKGKWEATKGKLIMVCVDGSTQAHKAFQRAVSLIKPEDHLFCVAIRSLASVTDVSRRTESLSETTTLLLRYELWKATRNILTPYKDELKRKNIPCSVYFPEAKNTRRMLCKIAMYFDVDLLILGLNGKGHQKRGHSSRSGIGAHTSYCLQHARCPVMIVK